MLTAPWANYLPDTQKPDSYAGFDSAIPDDFVLARYPDGSVRAKFSDNNWEFGSDSGQQISFTNIVESELIDNPDLYEEIVYQSKCIMFALIYTPRIRSQRVQPSTLRSRLKVIRRIAKLCYLEGISFKEMDTSASFQNDLKSSILNLANGWTNTSSAYQSKITFDEYHKVHESGSLALYGLSRIFPLNDALPYSLLIKRAIAALRSKGSERTMLIPRRILANIIDNGLLKVDELLPYADGFVKYAKLSVTSKKASHDVLCKTAKITKVLDSIGIKSFVELKSYLGLMQDVCRVLTYAFTGMRDSEVNVIPWDAYKEYDIPNYGMVPFIQGHHRKMKKRNYSGKVQWVTAPEMKNVIRVAQSAALFRAIINTESPDVETSSLPLWVGSDSHSKVKNDHYGASIRSFKFNQHLLHRLGSFFDIFMTQEDLVELYKFDSYRDWSKKESLKAGMPWPISTHQFRRSLAVYASRSGMVSLPSLGNQYKHISLLMTAMYSEKSSYAEHFIPRQKDGSYIDEFGIVNDFNEERVASTAANFHAEAIERAASLHGPKGSMIQRQKDSGNLDVTYLDRENTIRAMKDKRNPMRYASTVVGGCLRGSICESYALDIIVPCTKDCADAILMQEKIDAYVDDLEMGLDDISKNSMEYKTTLMEIKRIRGINVVEVE